MGQRLTRTNTPLLEPAVALITGIAAVELWTPHGAWGLVLCVLGMFVLAGVIALVWRVIDRQKPRTFLIQRAILWSLFGLLGLGLAIWHRIDSQQTIATRHHSERFWFMGQITTIPNPSGKWLRSEAALFCYAADTNRPWKKQAWEWHPLSSSVAAKPEKIWLYLDTVALRKYGVYPTVGDIVQFRGRIYSSLVEDSSGYNQYMLRTRGITGRSYTWRIDLLERNTSTLSSRVAILRHHLSRSLATGVHPEEAGIMQALAVGEQGAIDRELRTSYARTGVAHLLSVSGLHVGIVFLILHFLLGWIRLFRHGNTILGITVIGLLCSYAVFTGLSPSVLRAVLMFSLLQIGLMTSRYTNPFNTLCAAAIALLIWNPYYLYHIGFQLSFAAMAGILTLYRPLAQLWQPKWRVVRWLWSLTLVTVTAQIGTAPLVAHHFGQLQLAGILLNPLVWFTVPVIIGGALLYLVCGWIWVLEVTQTATHWQNSIVKWAARQPWIGVEGAHLSANGCAAIYLVIIVLILIINNRWSNGRKGRTSYFLQGTDAVELTETKR